jgi:hypothetical protein
MASARMNDLNQGLVAARPKVVALYLLFALLTSIGSLYVLSRHASHPFWLAAMLLAILLGPLATATFVYCPGWLQALLSSRGFWLVCVVAITAIDITRYHHHLHAFEANPSTAAPALVQPAIQLIHGHDPYQVRLEGGVPISPGPGWIILLAPVTSLGGVAALLGLVVGLCTYLVRQEAPASAGLIILFVLMQPLLLSQSMVAHDIFVIPIFFSVLCLLAERWIDSSTKLVALAAVAAAFATSRLPMIILVLILSIGLYRLRAKAGALFFAVSVPLTLLLHGTFYLWARKDHVFYQPLHLLSRGARATNPTLQLIGISAVLLVALSMLLRMGACAKDWIAYAGLFLAAAFVPVGLGQLRFLNGHYELWEGSNYVSFGASLLAIAVALNYRSKQLKPADAGDSPRHAEAGRLHLYLLAIESRNGCR